MKDTDFQNEKALMLGELYRKDGAWRFSAIGQGFDGGLNALVKHFGGGDVAEEIQPVVKISLEKGVNQQKALKFHGILANLLSRKAYRLFRSLKF